MHTADELREGALSFEQKHNSRCRYSKLNGKTSLETLAQSGNKALRFPPNEQAPAAPLKKPKSGRYHLIRFIRSDFKLDIFGKRFRISLDLQYEYVVANSF
jgi:hypothetical protein